MKICGTVQRPVSWIIVGALRRARGRRGSRRSVRRRAACRSALARWQYGQPACCTSSRVASVLRVRPSSRSAGWRRARRSRPPASARAFSKPSFFSSPRRAARARRSGRRRRAAATCSSAARASASRLASGTLRAPAAWPAAYSAGSLMSISTAFSRLISRTASAVDDLRAGAALRSASARAAGRRRPARRRTDTSCRRTKFTVRAPRARSGKARIIEFAPSAPGSRLIAPSSARSARMHKLVLLRHGESTWNLENRFTGWTDVDLTPNGVEQARAGRRLLKAGGYEFDVAYTSVLKRAIWTLWHALDEMDRTWLPVAQRLAPERAPLRRAAGPQQGRDGAPSSATSRCSPGGAATTCRRRRSRPTTRAASAAICATPRSSAGAGAADRVPEGHRGARAAVLERRRSRRRSRAGERVLVAAHGNSMRALVKYLDGIGDAEIVGLNIPNGIPLVYELDDGAEADPPLLPRRRRGGGARRRPRSRNQGEPERRDLGARRRGAASMPRARRCRRAARASARRSACAEAAAPGSRRTRTPSPQAMCHRLSQQGRRADELDRALPRAPARRSAAPPAAPASRWRSPPAAGWHGTAAGRGPVDVVPSGNTRPRRRRAAHRRPGARRAAHRACVRARGTACRPQSTSRATSGQCLDVGLGDEARVRHDGVDRHDVEPRDVVGHQQAAAVGAARRRARGRCRARRTSSATTSGCARWRAAASSDGNANSDDRQAVQAVRDARARAARRRATRRIATPSRRQAPPRRRRRGRRRACSARAPASRGERTACGCCWLAQGRAVDGPASSGSKRHRSATAPSTQAARRRGQRPHRGRPSTRRRLAGHARERLRERQLARRRPTSAPRPSSSSRPVAPGSASANGRCLASSSTGVWSRRSASIVPSASAGADRIAVALLAQRRHQPHRRVEVADVDVDQVQRGGC